MFRETPRRYTQGEPRILDWDIENRPLAYWYDGQTSAEITAIGWGFVGEGEVEVLLLQRDGKYEDNAGIRYPAATAFQMFADVLAEADMVTGHYMRKHDLPILNSAMIENGLAPLRPLLVQDTHGDFVRRKDLSISQENLAEMFAMPEAKHSMTQTLWRQANRLEDEGILQARKRVVDDVLQHKALRLELLKRGLLKPPRMWRP